MTKFFRTYKVSWKADYNHHERFMSVSWVSHERHINEILFAEFGYRFYAVDAVQISFHGE